MELTPSTPAAAVPRDGFALPWALFVLVLLGLICGAGFLLSWIDLRSARGFEAGTRALFVAEGGLATALAGLGRPAAPVDTVPIGGDTAVVAWEPLLDIAAGETLYRVTSRGSVRLEGLPLVREIFQVVWAGDPPRTPAALFVAGPVLGSPSGRISGLDGSVCTGGDAAGAMATGPGIVGTPPGPRLEGAPPWRTFPPAGSVPASTGIRWVDLVGPEAAAPDATVPPDPWPPGGTGWPVVRHAPAGPVGRAGAGRGTLLVDGDLDLADGFAWQGLVLAGGSIRFLGDATIRGSVLAGLDPARPGSSVDLGAGRLDLVLDRCIVTAAAARLAPRPAAVRGTWRERW